MALWPRRPSIEALVFEHDQDLYRFAYRMTGVAADAEDLTQVTFCRAQEALSRLRHPRKAKAWLFRILRNLYLQDRRQGAARSHLPWTSVEEEFSLPAEAVTRTLREERLEASLLRIEEIYRTPVILFYFGSFSYQGDRGASGSAVGNGDVETRPRSSGSPPPSVRCGSTSRPARPAARGSRESNPSSTASDASCAASKPPRG